MDSEKRERYIRWQNYRVNQLTFSINLFLAFAVASLAYVINLKLYSQADTNTGIYVFPIYWWAASAGTGTIATLSRLLDFRFTAKKIKTANQWDKRIASFLGKFTWGAFWVQVITYAIGGYVFIENILSL